MKSQTLRIASVLCLLAVMLAAQAKPAPKNAAPDYSGRYSFLQEGEDLQLDITDGKVDGYISRLGDSETDRDTAYSWSTASIVRTCPAASSPATIRAPRASRTLACSPGERVEWPVMDRSFHTPYERGLKQR